MTPDYKTRRDAESSRLSDELFAFMETGSLTKGQFNNIFQKGADWARADLMREVEEILVKALQKTQDLELWSAQRSLENPAHLRKLVHNNYVFAREALTAWQAIKESDNDWREIQRSSRNSSRSCFNVLD